MRLEWSWNHIMAETSFVEKKKELLLPGVSEVPWVFWLMTDSSQTTGRVDRMVMLIAVLFWWECTIRWCVFGNWIYEKNDRIPAFVRDSRHDRDCPSNLT